MMYNRGDETVICPYDETHNIQKKSFQAHLIRCREANKGKVKMVVCKFDKTHIVAKPELRHHMQDCPSKRVLDRDIQCRGNFMNVLTGDVRGPEIKGSHCAEIDEDWDAAPQRGRTQALFNPPSDGYSDDEETESYFTSGSSHVKKLSCKKLSQPCEESSEQTQRTVPLTQSKAAMLSEPTQPRALPSSSGSLDGSVVYDIPTLSHLNRTAMGATNAGLQNVPVGRSRGLIGANAPSMTTGLSFGRGVTKHASCLTKPAVKPWGQTVTPGHPSDAYVPAKFPVPVQPSVYTTSAHSTNSSLPTWSPGTSSDASSDYNDRHEIPTAAFKHLEERAARANKALSANHTRELEELLQNQEQERQQLLHKQEQERTLVQQRQEQERTLVQQRQEQERALVQQRQENERDLAFQQHEQLIRQLLLQLTRSAGGENAMSLSDPSMLSRLQILSLSQPGNLNLSSSDDRSEKYPGPLSSPGSLSYAQALSTKSVPYSDVTSDVSSVSWCEDETESDVNDIDDDSCTEMLSTANTADSPNQIYDFSEMTPEDLRQQKKKFEKKIKQIAALERRIYKGEDILPEEEKKIKRKTKILEQLEVISNYL